MHVLINNNQQLHRKFPIVSGSIKFLLRGWFCNSTQVNCVLCVLICTVVSDSLWPLDCSPPGSFVHGIFQARILEQVAISYSGDLPNWGIEPESLASPELVGGFFTAESAGKPSRALTVYNTSNNCSDAFSGIGRGGLSRHLSLPHSLNVFTGIRDSFSGALKANCKEWLEC